MLISDRESNLARKVILDQHIAYIEKMVARGGPNPSEPRTFDCWLEEVSQELRLGKLTEEDLIVLRESFGTALSTRTLQGFSLRKPHGYPGDYEIIDKIYLEHITDDPALKNWDLYYQNQSAATAVRNRKTYFLRLLQTLRIEHGKKAALPVLNVASGPARDLAEFYENTRNGCKIQFECVDLDRQAIEYAQDLCAPYLDQIDFYEVNALRFRSDQDYQLVWSAGLFDYLSNKGFQYLLTNLLSMLRENGELVIGNFGRNNPTREYMEIMTDWSLYYRTTEELIRLAMDCGVKREDIRVGQEPEGVNLFLHIKQGPNFLDLEAAPQLDS